MTNPVNRPTAPRRAEESAELMNLHSNEELIRRGPSHKTVRPAATPRTRSAGTLHTRSPHRVTARTRVSMAASLPATARIPSYARLPSPVAAAPAHSALGTLIQKEAVHVGGTIVARTVSGTIIQVVKGMLNPKKAAPAPPPPPAVAAPASKTTP